MKKAYASSVFLNVGCFDCQDLLLAKTEGAFLPAATVSKQNHVQSFECLVNKVMSVLMRIFTVNLQDRMLIIDHNRLRRDWRLASIWITNLIRSVVFGIMKCNQLLNFS